MGFSIFINQNSGSFQQHGEEGFSSLIHDILEKDVKEIHFLEPDQIPKALQSHEGTSHILVGGGDGTIMTAANIFKQKKRPFGVLPLGTMNCLIKDMNMPINLVDAVKGYKNYEERFIDVGYLNNEMFLCNAMIGITSDLAREREKRRHEKNPAKWLEFAKKSFDTLTGDKDYNFTLKYEGQTDRQDIKALIISNNPYDMGPTPGNIFKKKSLGDGKLGVYLVNPHGTVESIQLLFSLALGSWPNDQSIEYLETQKLEVLAKNKQIPVLLDGELRNFKTPLKFSCEPASLHLLVPAPAQGEAA